MRSRDVRPWRFRFLVRQQRRRDVFDFAVLSVLARDFSREPPPRRRGPATPLAAVRLKRRRVRWRLFRPPILIVGTPLDMVDGSKVNPRDSSMNNPYMEHLKTTNGPSNPRHIHGGPISPGRYTLRTPATTRTLASAHTATKDEPVVLYFVGIGPDRPGDVEQ